MDQHQPELTLEESIKQVMQTLPPVIRAYLAQGKYTVVARSLMAKYGLRIDQGGVLEREIMLLLMGIESPDEFTQALIEEAKLDQKVVSNIVQDINAQIFVPLREEEMKNGMGNTPQSPAPEETPAIPRLVVPTVPTVAPRPPIAPGAGEPQKFFHLQNKIPAPPAPSKPIIAAPRPANPGLSAAVAAATKPPASEGKASAEKQSLILLLEKLKESNKLLEDHEEPHIELGVRDKVQGVSSVPSPAPLKPNPLPLTPSVQPHPVAPGARFAPTPAPKVAVPVAPRVPSSPIATTTPIPPAPLKATHAPSETSQGAAPTPSSAPKPHSADPYREPIE